MNIVRNAYVLGVMAGFSFLIAGGAFAQNRTAPRVEYLEQGWTTNEQDQRRQRFYNTSQGSRLLPYSWFVHLERPNSTEPFISDSLDRFGYLPRSRELGAQFLAKSYLGNPDGLPVGFVIDSARDQNWVGLNCAACHTSRMTYKGRVFQIDGAPGQGDLQALLHELADAVSATARDDEKLRRLYNAISGASEQGFGARQSPDLMAGEGRKFKERFVSWATGFAAIMARDSVTFAHSQGADRWGPSRTDAFGMIFNRVAGLNLGDERNLFAANAAVSHPFLWTTNRQTQVQWNGLIDKNLGIEQQIGRNVGQVLGVFGALPNLGNPGSSMGRYISSAHVPNLWFLGQAVGTPGRVLASTRLADHLTAPKWPESVFGLGDLSKTQVEQMREVGKRIYDAKCADCHRISDARDGNSITSVMVPIRDAFRSPGGNQYDVRLNTDPLMAENVLRHRSFPGPLTDDLREKIDARDGRVLSADIVGLVVTRVIVANGDKPKAVAGAASEVSRIIAQMPVSGRAPPFSTAAGADANRLMAYKAGPLFGVWATGPFLHNGSVPDLWALLMPSECPTGKTAEELVDLCRPTSFAVGNREFDPRLVGYSRAATSTSFLFDTRRPGNFNRGHEGEVYGTTLPLDQKRSLLEYLKVIGDSAR
jgi:hypothetical protein